MSKQFTQSASYPGLGTFIVNIPETNMYSIQGTLSLNDDDGSALQGPGGGAGTGTGAPPPIPSQVVVTIKQNSSTIFTSNSGAKGFCLNSVSLVSGDVLSVITSSSLAQDQLPNAVKLILAVAEGPI